MNANEIYKLKPLRETQELYELCGFYYNHVPEIDIYDINSSLNTKISIKEHCYHNFDGRRYWKLSSVWYEDKPVMIIQNAGREGDDHAKRFITDIELYSTMVDYLLTLQNKPQIRERDVISDDVDMPELTNFYGHDLSEFCSDINIC